MLSLTPSMTPADTHGVFKLLDLLTDPNAVRERLAELLKAKQELDASAQSAQEETAKLAAAKTDYTEKIATLNRAGIAQENKEKAIFAREQVVSGREASLRQKTLEREMADDARTRDLNKREDEVKRREDLVTTGTLQLKQRLVEVGVLKTQLETKLAKIKEINDAVL